MGKPHVLCFGRFSDAIPGGIQRHVEHLLSGLRDRVDFVNLVPNRNWSNESFKRFGVPTVARAGINVDGSLVLSPGLCREARALHRQRPFDLVHLHFPDPMSHLAAMMLPSVPRVITWHADIFRHRTALAFYRPFLRRAAENAAAIIVATEAHRLNSPILAGLTGVEKKTHVVPFGFDLDRFLQPAAQLPQLRGRHPGRIVFSLGRHVYYKGFDMLLQAMTRLPPDIALILGGTGPLTPELKALTGKLGLEDRVCFAGLIDEDMLPAYFQLCDVFCLPAVSRAEAFGIVQVEAMASGKPVVSTRLGNGVDLVNRHGETGLTVEPGDPAALASALGSLLSDPQRATRLGEAGRQRALAEYGLGQMVERTFEIYRSVLAR